MLTTSVLPQWELLAAGSEYLTDWQASGVFVPSWRLYWCDASASSWVRWNGAHYELGPDTLLMIAPNTCIEAGLDRPVHHVWFHFRGGEPWDGVTNWVGWRSLSEDWSREVSSLARDLSDQGNLESFSLRVRLAALISHGMTTVPERRLTTESLDPRTAEALREMRRNLGAKPGGIARKLNLGSTTLNRLFHNAFGEPPGRVLALLRDEYARHLLEHTDLPVAAVAEKCGFCDRHHFSRRFRKTHGRGPATYRREQRGAPSDSQTGDPMVC